MKHLLLLLITLSFFSTIQAQKDTNDFVTTWRTTNFGQGGDSTVVIPIDTNYTYNFDVDWDNDGVFDDLGVTDTIVHQYTDTGTYTIRIRGLFPRFFVEIIDFQLNIFGDNKLISLDQWGNNPWQNVEYMFRGLSNFIYNAVDTPNLTQVTSLKSMFENNVSFNGNISNWNISNITDLSFMFSGCISFNQPLNSWDVSNVANFEFLFQNTPFNQSLNSWNTTNAKDFDGMFKYSAFNQPIDNWDVSNVTAMSFTFEGGVFNQPLNSWQTDSLQRLASTFANNLFFNQPLNNWNTSRVRSMGRMFVGATSFNQPLNNWNTSSVFAMRDMFNGAVSFNQDVGDFDLSNIFNAPQIGIFEMASMLDDTNLSTANYDSTLIKWSKQNLQCCIITGARGLTYCMSDSIRNYLTSSVTAGGKGWTIIGDSLDCLGVGAEEVVLQEQAFFNVYPNPTNDLLYVEMPSAQAVQQNLIMYNVQGQLVFSKTISQDKEVIDVSQFKSGIYLLRLGEKSKRIVVQ